MKKKPSTRVTLLNQIYRMLYTYGVCSINLQKLLEVSYYSVNQCHQTKSSEWWSQLDSTYCYSSGGKIWLIKIRPECGVQQEQYFIIPMLLSGFHIR